MECGGLDTVLLQRERRGLTRRPDRNPPTSRASLRKSGVKPPHSKSIAVIQVERLVPRRWFGVSVSSALGTTRSTDVGPPWNTVVSTAL